MKFKFCVFVIIIMLMLSVACLNPYDGPAGVYKPFEDGAVIEVDGNNGTLAGSNDKLFKEESDASGEKIVFKTANSKFWSVRGYTLWKFIDEIDSKEPYMSFEKLSGVEEAGYGVVCYSKEEEIEEEVNGSTVKRKRKSMLCILVYKDGLYSVGNVVDGLYNSIVYKESSNSLKAGCSNSVKVRKISDEKKIEIYFNKDNFDGDADYVINDSDKYVLGEGKAGVVAIISPKDKFPEEPVWIEYRVCKKD